MFKTTQTYTTFDGNEVTEDFYFNFTKAELLELEVDADGGSLHDLLLRIVAAKDNSKLIKEFKKLIRMAYGIKDEDGKHFRKSDTISEDFSHHPAFSDIFMRLLEEPGFAAEFAKGCMPADMQGEVLDEAMKQAATEVAETLDTSTDALGRPAT